MGHQVGDDLLRLERKRLVEVAPLVQTTVARSEATSSLFCCLGSDQSGALAVHRW